MSYFQSVKEFSSFNLNETESFTCHVVIMLILSIGEELDYFFQMAFLLTQDSKKLCENFIQILQVSQ